jgi:hypothetical protein
MLPRLQRARARLRNQILPSRKVNKLLFRRRLRVFGDCTARMPTRHAHAFAMRR